MWGLEHVVQAPQKYLKLDKGDKVCYNVFMRLKHLPKTIKVWKNHKEEVLELQKIYNVFRNDIQITNMLKEKLA